MYFLIAIKAATLIFISGRGLAISSVKERKSCFILILYMYLVHVILLEPFIKLVTVYTLNTHLLAHGKRQSQQVICFCRLHKSVETSLTNSVDPDQTAPGSCLIWGLNCLPLYLRNSINNILRVK